MTSSRWLILLNGIDLEQSSACLGSSPTLRYPVVQRPMIQPARSCPERRSIAHFMVTEQTWAHLREDLPGLDEIRAFRVPTNGDRLVLLTHWPRRTPTKGKPATPPTATDMARSRSPKMQADEIVSSISTIPGIDSLLEGMIEFSRWDVLASLQAGASHAHPLYR